jgi:hypothetical protein
MTAQLDAIKIRRNAKALDDAIEKRDIEGLVSYFTEQCEIELLGIKLLGHAGLRKAIAWMYQHLGEIKLVPITIMIDRDVFFEEFTVRAKVRGEREIEVKQAEVLVFGDDYRVKSLRLYFDRLELARAFSSNPLDRVMMRQVSRASLRGLLP